MIETAENLEREYGIPIVNKRVSVTPVAQIAAAMDAALAKGHGHADYSIFVKR